LTRPAISTNVVVAFIVFNDFDITEFLSILINKDLDLFSSKINQIQ